MGPDNTNSAWPNYYSSRKIITTLPVQTPGPHWQQRKTPFDISGFGYAVSGSKMYIFGGKVYVDGATTWQFEHGITTLKLVHGIRLALCLPCSTRSTHRHRLEVGSESRMMRAAVYGTRDRIEEALCTGRLEGEGSGMNAHLRAQLFGLCATFHSQVFRFITGKLYLRRSPITFTDSGSEWRL